LRLQIYSRKECHLCDEAKADVYKVIAGFPVTVEEIDIDSDPDALRAYQYEIPVIVLDGRKLFKYRVDKRKLRKAIQQRIKSEGGRDNPA